VSSIVSEGKKIVPARANSELDPILEVDTPRLHLKGVRRKAAEADKPDRNLSGLSRSLTCSSYLTKAES
jgi:hypothetical protein